MTKTGKAGRPARRERITGATHFRKCNVRIDAELLEWGKREAHRNATSFSAFLRGILTAEMHRKGAMA